MKPFDIEKAKAGAAIITRDGKPARLLAADIKGDDDECLAVAVDEGSYEWISTWRDAGNYMSHDKHGCDLFMAPVKRTVWVPLYHGVLTDRLIAGCTYDTEADALAYGSSGTNFIGAFPITFEE